MNALDGGLSRLLDLLTARPNANELLKTLETEDKNGQLVYTFTVGTSTGIVPGKYNAVVSFPTANTAGAAIGKANISVPYEISGGSAVTNADVLKSSVALIA